MVCLVASLLLLLSGCGKEPVELDRVELSLADASRCQALVTALPDAIDSAERRLVFPAAALGAAWGSPPIVLRCVENVDIPSTAICQEVDGVGWYAPESSAGDQTADVVLTTVGWTPTLRVALPAEYRPPTSVMVDLAPIIKQTLKLTEPCR
jgi:hypothetical protein